MPHKRGRLHCQQYASWHNQLTNQPTNPSILTSSPINFSQFVVSFVDYFMKYPSIPVIILSFTYILIRYLIKIRVIDWSSSYNPISMFIHCWFDPGWSGLGSQWHLLFRLKPLTSSTWYPMIWILYGQTNIDHFRLRQHWISNWFTTGETTSYSRASGLGRREWPDEKKVAQYNPSWNWGRQD